MTSTKYLVLLCSLLIIFSSCEKYNQLDNTGIVKTPYVLYAGGLDGQLHKTNDANYFQKLFPVDGVPVRQIIVADSNILYLKKNCYVSDDQGRAFNVTNTNTLPFVDLFYRYFMPNQMIYDKSEKLVYLCTNSGLLQSNDLGKTFSATSLGINPASVTELENGDIIAIQDASNIYVRTGGVLGWTQVTAGSSTLAAGNKYYLSSYGATLVATDYDGVLGSYFSVNGGADWTKYDGVSGNGRAILFVNNPKGSTDLFLGRDSTGLFKLDPTTATFEPSGAGIPWYAKVQFVEGKTLVFRNDVKRFYLFCATDAGLYVSESGGADWSLARPGEYSTLQ